jgi:hypothetical protein
MSSLFNPVAGVESAITAGFEREAAKALLGTVLSGWITFLWKLGSVPLIGRPAAAAAAAMYANVARTEALRSILALTVPAGLMDPNVQAEFITVQQK